MNEEIYKHLNGGEKKEKWEKTDPKPLTTRGKQWHLPFCNMKEKWEHWNGVVFWGEEIYLELHMDFPGGSDGKASAYNVGDPGSIPGSGRSSGEGNGNPLQYSCLENPVDGGAW